MSIIGEYWISYMDLKGKGEKIEMPTISKIRFTNAVYDNGEKRYNDEIFEFDGYNGVILLENGGGKTTFIQIALQAMLPHSDIGDRKIRETLSLDGNPCHIGIEWIINERPRRYALTCVTLFLNAGKLDSYRYVYEYGYDDRNSIDNVPFVKETVDGSKRPASREEMGEYYQYMCNKYLNAKMFSSIKAYNSYIEENFKIISKEWRRIGIINGEEGGVDKFFEGCKTTENLVNKLLIPVVEEAMSGNGSQEFADTFEEQRGHFKQYNLLKESIDESKKIQSKIREYVDKYNKYHESMQSFDSQRSYGKAIYQYLSNECEEVEAKLEENKEKKKECEYDFIELGRMDASYELGVLKSKLELSEFKYKEILKKSEIIGDELHAKESRLQNLRIARYRKIIKGKQDEIDSYEEQIDKLGEDEEVYAIEQELKLNSSNIKAYFDFQLRKLEEEIGILQSIKMRCEDELKEIKREIDKLEEESNRLYENQIRLDQDYTRNEESMRKIENTILSNPKMERIEDEYPKWSQRVGFIERYLVECQERSNLLKDEKDNIKIALKKSREELELLSNDRIAIREKIESINNEERELLLRIKEWIPSLLHVNSIYTKQGYITSTLENISEKARKEKEKAIIDERIFYRFIDDYKDNDYFTAEPLLYNWINQWKDQFAFLESGSEFIERAAAAMGKSEQEYYNLYPYWAASVVIADDEQYKLKDKLEHNVDKLTYPIIILSQSNARDILRKTDRKMNDYLCVYPLIWADNIAKVGFQSTKFELDKKAERATQIRQDKENEFINYDNLHIDISDFLDKYPYVEYFAPLKNQFKDVEEKISEIKNTSNNKTSRIDKIDEKLENINKEMKNLDVEKYILNNKINSAMEYINKKRETIKIRNDLYEIEKAIDVKKAGLLRLNAQKEDKQGKMDDLDEKIKRLSNMMSDITKDELYDDVKDAVPKGSEIEIEVLKTKKERYQRPLE
jgi:hypothetical protein